MAALSAIVGLGRSPLSRKVIGSARELAAQAVRATLADAALKPSDIDGLLLNQSALAPAGTLPLSMIDDLGLRDLRLLSQVEGKGASVIQMVQQATLSILHGMASRVVCVFADAPVGADKGAGASYQNETPLTGVPGWEGRYGLFGPVGSHALLAQRYLAVHAGRDLSLGAYALACRKWSALDPDAALRDPLTPEAYQASRPIAEPLRLLDCAYPLNGGVAVVVCAVDRAGDHPQRPVYLHGFGQGHRTVSRLPGERDLETAAVVAARDVYAMADVTPQDVSACQIYDAFSIDAVLALEDYGLAPRGEALALLASGATSPGGRLPANTGGGHLAQGYLQGMTPLAEAVVQGRGLGGARQVARNDVILVTGAGGCLEYHAAAVLSPHVRWG